MSKDQSRAGAAKLAVTLVIPLFNEEKVIPELIREIELFRENRSETISVLLIDDGSRDASNALIRTLTSRLSGYRVIRFSRNFGHQLAVTAGLQAVSADAAVIMDADLQDPLEVAGEMIDKWKQGFDVVYGIRKKRTGVSVVARLSYRLYYRLFSRLTDMDAPVDAGDFRLLSKRVIRAYREFNEQQPYVRGLIAWMGFDQIGVEYERPARFAGKSKYSWSKLFQLGFDGIASFSSKPLRYAVKLGLLLSALSVFGLIWALVEKLWLNTDLPGWASLVFIGFFFGGLQLFFLGVVGSYVARVYEEVKSRPRFIIQDSWISGGISGSGKAEADDSREHSITSRVGIAPSENAEHSQHSQHSQHETE